MHHSAGLQPSKINSPRMPPTASSPRASPSSTGAPTSSTPRAGNAPAELSGRLRHAADERGDLPAVGDWVAVTPTEPAMVQAVLPRRTKFSRMAANDHGQTIEQVVAANVDVVFLDRRARRRPERPPARAVPDARLGERRRAGRRPHEGGSLRRRGGGALRGRAGRDRRARARRLNVTGEGVEALRPYFAAGRTVAALGSSGVGKSSLVNRLAGEELMAVGDLRADGKGRHTTTNRQLLLLPGGGLFLDTPGMREIRLWESEEGLETAFDDVDRGGGALPLQRLLARGRAGLRRPRRARRRDARRGALHQLAEASGRAAAPGDEAGQPSARGGAEGAAAVCPLAAEGVVVSRR